MSFMRTLRQLTIVAAGVAAAIIPGGPFLLERRLARLDAQSKRV